MFIVSEGDVHELKLKLSIGLPPQPFLLQLPSVLLLASAGVRIRKLAHHACACGHFRSFEFESWKHSVFHLPEGHVHQLGLQLSYGLPPQLLLLQLPALLLLPSHGVRIRKFAHDACACRHFRSLWFSNWLGIT